MNKFDKYIKSKAKEEQIQIPESVKKQINYTLAQLPEKNIIAKKSRLISRIAVAAACFIFITVFLLPNVSLKYAKAMEKIPLIGDIIRVVTIRNYFYSDDRHEMNINVPKIEDEKSDADDCINKDVSELTKMLVNEFYKDLEISGNQGYGSIDVDYETITNTGEWFTLKLSVSETAASSNNYFKYYHIDKIKGKVIKLSDLFKTDEFSDALVKDIRRQMEDIMKEDKNAIFWMNEVELGEKFESVSADHNFYWNKNGDLVIIFDKYEVAPGFMHTPEFIINKKVIKDILKPEYLKMFI